MTDRLQDDSARKEAHRVVSLYDIVIHILGSLEKRYLAVTARVCRTWVDPALDTLWEELDSVHPIMRLLGPIRCQSDGWDWEYGSPRGDPARFASYCKRIKSLSYDAADDYYGGTPRHRMCTQVPAKLLCYLASNQGEYLLPQIRTLRWYCDGLEQLQLVVPFISPTIKDIIIEDEWENRSSKMDRDLLLRVLRAVIPPCIRALHFVVGSDKPEGVSDEMTTILEAHDELQELRLPSYLLGPIMLKPNLRLLEVDFIFGSYDNLEHLLSQLADTCSFLQDLRITFWQGDCIEFELIRPLLRCSKLRILDLDYRKTFDLGTKDIQEMGKAWRELEVLHIAGRRVYGTPVDARRRTIESQLGLEGIPIGSLVTFAESFSPKLRQLGLYLNTQYIPTPPISPIAFPNLKVLFVGTSFLNEKNVAKAFAFLTTITPPRIEIEDCGEDDCDTTRYVWGLAYRIPLRNSSWQTLSRMLEGNATGAMLLAEFPDDHWDGALTDGRGSD